MGGHDPEAHGPQTLGVNLHRARRFSSVLALQSLADPAFVHDDDVDQPLRGVPQNRFDVIRGAEVHGLARLPHQVDDIGLERAGTPDGLGDAVHQQVGYHAGEQGTGPHRDHVGLRDGLQGLLERRRPARPQFHLLDSRPALADAGFAAHDRSVREPGFERHVCRRRGINASGDGQDFRGNPYRLRKIAGHVGQRRQKKVAETVTLQPAPRGKPVLEQTRHQRRVRGQGHQAITDVPRGENIEIAAQASRASPIVRHGHHCRDVHGRSLGERLGRGVTPQPTQQGGQTGASTEGYHPQHGFATWLQESASLPTSRSAAIGGC